ncbi:DUF2802 domain-containing protein [Ectothiorhodospiraceae bacterium WFHF3C12]|nr:DUF2802 domain-containing protein [Ectothiorhodospiraceae bacterium WFHF3C12]
MTSLEPGTYLSLLLLIVCVVLAVFVAMLFARLDRQARRIGALEQSQKRVAEYMRGVSAGAVGQGQHVARLEQDLARVRDRMERVASSEGGGSTAFNHAIRMAQRGATAEELMEACGLSQMEADLVVLLHRDQQVQ